VLSFTADEIWRHLPGERGESVFLATWYESLFTLDGKDAVSRDDWAKALEVRAEVSRHLEQARKAGAIGAGLDAEVDLYCEPGLYEALAKLGDELRFLLITSAARLHPAEAADKTAVGGELEGLQLTVTPSEHAKCVRCWHHRPDVGADDSHPELCGRCVENVDGTGEIRLFV